MECSLHSIRSALYPYSARVSQQCFVYKEKKLPRHFLPPQNLSCLFSNVIMLLQLPSGQVAKLVQIETETLPAFIVYKVKNVNLPAGTSICTGKRRRRSKCICLRSSHRLLSTCRPVLDRQHLYCYCNRTSLSKDSALRSLVFMHDKVACCLAGSLCSLRLCFCLNYATCAGKLIWKCQYTKHCPGISPRSDVNLGESISPFHAWG